MNRLTRDGTAEPVSRDQILRRERGRGKNTRLIHALLFVMTIHVHNILINFDNATRLLIMLQDYYFFRCSSFDFKGHAINSK